ncbi:hypothetical protein CG51_01265 [Haematobacter missouriensis]|uniref:3-hydroxyacyl-CoA dehydrogenase n=1 Tax=Haematobacter missouriensis TaxID=366616 RepID=A0A212AJW9_9RHOB|nr:enoyl-CoA hydratase-related protein [Haematobacter missouriensis]KFI32627.1 hypothetical protein CG51_01265 [Haematobacter missouriensis]OWJ76755.1 hypothetical protein CDV53_07570 [Haematobacter missouriensis]OWJ81747.1 hypothetical protein CDV52_17445 [Haematobacter missouriensis]
MFTTDIDAEGIATVTIDMPGRSMNVIDWALTDALDAEARALAANPAVKAIVLTSGKKDFVAGADLAIMHDLYDLTPEAASDRIGTLGAMVRAFETSGKPVVGAAPGTALGGGLEILLGCNYRIAADNPKARFGLPEVTLGILPGAGGTQRLPRIIGIPAALPVLVYGKPMTAEQAKAAGILDEVVPPDNLLAAAKAAVREGRVRPGQPWDEKGFALPGPAPQSSEAMDLFSSWNAKVLAETSGNRPAPKAILSCVFEGTRVPIDAGLKIERDYFGTLVTGDVAPAMVWATFEARIAASKEGRNIADPDGPYVTSGVSALLEETRRLREEGVPDSTIETAAAQLGMARTPKDFGAGKEIAEMSEAMDTVPLEDVKDRLLFAQVSAAATALQGGAVALAAEADYGAVAGWGFPVHLGGPIYFARQLGPEGLEQRMGKLETAYGLRFAPPPVIAAVTDAAKP